MDLHENEDQGPPAVPKVHKNAQNEQDSADKEILEHHNALAQSKDRAQITASTAMSIVSVALLKAVLDTSPTNNRFYYLELTLIVVALALQILAGLMSLMVSNMLSYAEKYGKNFCEDWRLNCWPWKCMKTSQTDTLDVENAVEACDHTNHEHIALNQVRRFDAYRPWMNQAGHLEPERGACDCCLYTCTSRVYQPQDYVTFRNLSLWRSRRDYNELRAIEAKDHLDDLKRSIDEAQQHLEAKLKKDDAANKAELEERITTVKESLKSWSAQRDEWIQVMQDVAITRDQGVMLVQFDRSIRRRSVMKMVSFWQNMITVILYAVTILNLFITGFGLAARGGSSGVAFTNHTSGYT